MTQQQAKPAVANPGHLLLQLDPASGPHGPRWAVKRAIDVAVSGGLLVLLSPLLGLAALGIKLTSPGPVLFRQQRVGRHGRPFTMYKLRTFPVEHQDVVFSIPHADCPLWFGRLLRRTSIDELPQLANVFRGDMSLVGPRPERVPFAEGFVLHVKGYADRHRVPGGITGLAQVSGMHGNCSIDRRTELDNDYIDRWSLLADLRIVLRTPVAVLRKVHS